MLCLKRLVGRGATEAPAALAWRIHNLAAGSRGTRENHPSLCGVCMLNRDSERIPRSLLRGLVASELQIIKAILPSLEDSSYLSAGSFNFCKASPPDFVGLFVNIRE